MPDDRESRVRYGTPKVETVEASALIRALGPAQGMTSGVIEPGGPPWGPGGKKGGGNGD